MTESQTPLPSRPEIRARAERAWAVFYEAKMSGQNEHQVAIDSDEANTTYADSMGADNSVRYLEMYTQELQACMAKTVETVQEVEQEKNNSRLMWTGAMIGLVIGFPMLMRVCS